MTNQDLDRAEELKVLAALIVDCLPNLTLLIVERWLDKQRPKDTINPGEPMEPPGRKFLDKGE